MQPLALLNNAQAWLVTGFEEARGVLADVRFSSDRVRYRDATRIQPHEVAEMAAAAERGEPVCPAAIESRAVGMFVFMDPPRAHRGDAGRRIRGRPRARLRAADSLVGDLRAAGGRLRRSRGLPGEHRDRAEFERGDGERARVGAELYAFMARVIEAKRSAPADDILSAPGVLREEIDEAISSLGSGLDRPGH